MERVKINLCHPMSLKTLLALAPQQVDAILRFRAEHGPIQDAVQLGRILGIEPLPAALLDQIDFRPADDTSPEAPGA
jgi:hypothetical protein